VYVMGNPCNTVCLPLSYSGNPGVNWRISQGGLADYCRVTTKGYLYVYIHTVHKYPFTGVVIATQAMIVCGSVICGVGLVAAILQVGEPVMRVY
jgi:hypothetical protein